MTNTAITAIRNRSVRTITRALTSPARRAFQRSHRKKTARLAALLLLAILLTACGQNTGAGGAGETAAGPASADIAETSAASGGHDETADTDAHTSDAADSNPDAPAQNSTGSTGTTGATEEADSTANANDTEEADSTATANDTEETDSAAEASSGDDTDAEIFPAIDFTLTDQFGVTHTLSDYKGKVVFLNFWATWCPPCRAEMPDIQALYEKYAGSGNDDVIVLGVAAPRYGDETDREGIISFLEENGYSYPVAMDETGSTFNDYYIMSYPTTFFIDRDGNIWGYAPGMMSGEDMNRFTDMVLAGERPQR